MHKEVLPKSAADPIPTSYLWRASHKYAINNPGLKYVMVNMRLHPSCLILLLSASLSLTVFAQAPEQAAPETVSLPPTNDAEEIVRRSVDIDHHNFERAQNYTTQSREVGKILDTNGTVKKTESKTYDITFFYGEPYS